MSSVYIVHTQYRCWVVGFWQHAQQIQNIIYNDKKRNEMESGFYFDFIHR